MVKFHFTRPKLRKQPFLAKNLIRKCQISKSRGAKAPFPPSTPMGVRWCTLLRSYFLVWPASNCFSSKHFRVFLMQKIPCSNYRHCAQFVVYVKKEVIINWKKMKLAILINLVVEDVVIYFWFAPKIWNLQTTNWTLSFTKSLSHFLIRHESLVFQCVSCSIRYSIFPHLNLLFLDLAFSCFTRPG